MYRRGRGMGSVERDCSGKCKWNGIGSAAEE